jgi:hypothetical protein
MVDIASAAADILLILVGVAFQVPRMSGCLSHAVASKINVAGIIALKRFREFIINVLFV